MASTADRVAAPDPAAADPDAAGAVFDAYARGAAEDIRAALAAGTLSPHLRRIPHGGTLLHAAAQRGDAATVAALLAAGADVNAPAAEGVTPLMLGASPSPLAYQSCDVWLASDGAPRV